MFNVLHFYSDLSSIRGFTRETLSALVVDIESREWRRRYNKENNIPPEHPRASTTDDVECFFSVLRDMVGRDFTHKEVRVLEFIIIYLLTSKKIIGDVWVEEGVC